MNKYYNIILIIILLIIEFKTNYTIKKKISIKKGSLVVCTHNYEHKDIFITLQEIEKSNDFFYILFADEYWNYLIEPFRPTNSEFIYVKTNTVNKISNKIYLGYNVVLFLYEHNESKGVYHILKKTNAPLILLKIKGDKYGYNHSNSSYIKILFYNKNINYSVTYSKIKYNIDDYPIKFMKKIKNNLYN